MTVVKSTHFSIEGPWQIKAEAMLKLDEIVDSFAKKAEVHNNKIVAKYIDSILEQDTYAEKYNSMDEPRKKAYRKELISYYKKRYPYDINKRSLSFILVSNRVVPHVASFKELLSHPDLINEKVCAFSYVAERGGLKLNIELNMSSSKRFQVLVEPAALTKCQDTYAELHLWANTNRPDRLQTFWHKHSDLTLLAFILIFAFLTVLSALVPSSKYYHKHQAHELISNGVTKDNEHKAIELILAIQSEYRPPTQQVLSAQTRIFLIVFITLIVSAIIFSFGPIIMLDVGKGRDAILRNQWWCNFVIRLYTPALSLFNIIGCIYSYLA